MCSREIESDHTDSRETRRILVASPVPPRISTLERRIQKIQQELATLGDLRPGSLSLQYNVCGNPTCRCKATPPQKHGPYNQLSWTHQGKSRSQFVREEDLPIVRQQVKTYARQRALLERWTTSAVDLCRLKLEAQKK